MTVPNTRGKASRGSPAAASSGTLKDELVAHLRQDREELLREWLEPSRPTAACGWAPRQQEQESESARVYDACVDCLDTLELPGCGGVRGTNGAAGGAGNDYLRAHAWRDAGVARRVLAQPLAALPRGARSAR